MKFKYLITVLFLILTISSHSQTTDSDLDNYEAFLKEENYLKKKKLFYLIKNSKIKTYEEWISFFEKEEIKYKNEKISLYAIKLILTDLYGNIGKYKKAKTIALDHYYKNTNNLTKKQLCELLVYAKNNARELNDVLELIEIRKQKLKVCFIGKFKFHNIYSQIGLHDLALKSYKEFYYGEKKDRNSLDAGKDYNNIGVYHMRAKRWDSAYFYFKKALNTFEYLQENGVLKDEKKKKNNNFWIGLAKGNIAQYYISAKKYDKAIILLKEEEKIAHKFYGQKRWPAIDNFWEQISNCYINTNQLKIVPKYLDSLKKGNPYFYFKIKAQYLEKIGQKDSLDYYKERYNFKKDSLAKLKEERREKAIIKMIDFQQEIVDQKKEIDKLSYENKLKNNKTKTIYALLILTVTILLLISSFYYKLYKQKKIITSQNNSINKVLNEKNLLLRELHHRVKNNLQVMSSIMNLQLNRLKEPKLKNTYQYTINKINVLSILNEKLLKNKNLTEVSLLEYLNSIIDELKSVYISLKEINFNLNIDPSISVHIDQTQVLGLITNELITNSYKHAFKSSKKSQINISINQKNDIIYFRYYDNGIGFNIENVNNNNNSFGINLVSRLINQLQSSPNIISSNDKGMEINFNFIKKD